MDDTTVEVTRRGPECPTDVQLASYASGNTAVGVDLAEHIATCDACRAVVTASGSRRPETLPAGTMIGRYRIESCLGSGGMGVVYRAHDSELDRAIALKLVHSRGGRSADELAERLRRESRLQARLKHPAVITVHDIGRDEGRVYVAMELIEGVTLRAWVAEKTRRWRDIVDVFCRAGDGIAAAHDAGLVHRDFKPDNVLVEERAGAIVRVSVTDFGVARALEDGPTTGERDVATGSVELTLQSTLLGTPAYMAPEQLHCHSVDARADVFAFAVAVWQALYGERPYPGETIGAIAAAMEGPLAEPRRHATRDAPPRRILEALTRALAIDPDERTRSLRELLHALQRRRQFWVGAGIAAVAVTGAVVAFAVTRSGGESPFDGGDALVDELAVVRDRVDAVPDAAIRAALESSLDRYRTGWSVMRARAAAIGDANAVRCFDGNAVETAAYYDEILALPPERRGVVAHMDIPLPVGCMSSAAATLAALDPPRALAKRVARVRVALSDVEHSTRSDVASPTIATMSALANEARSIGFSPLQHEVAFVQAQIELDRTGKIDALREVASSADLAGHVLVALRAYVILLDELLRQNEKLDRVRDTLAHTEALMARAGEPPEDRTFLLGIRAYTAALSNDAPTARALAAEVEGRLTTIDVGMIEMLAHTYFGINDTARAEALLRRSLDRARRDPLVSPADMLVLEDSLGLVLTMSSRAPEAITLLEPVFARFEHDSELAGSPAFGSMLHTLAFAYNTAGSYDRALALIDRWRPLLAKQPGPPSFVTAKVAIERATALLAKHRADEAARECAFALEVFIERNGASAPEVADARILHGQALAEIHQLDAAREELERGITDLDKASPDDPGRAAQGQLQLADVLIQLHREADAVPIVERALATYQATHQAEPDVAFAELTLARALASRDRNRARALARHALEVWTKEPADWGPEIAKARLLTH